MAQQIIKMPYYRELGATPLGVLEFLPGELIGDIVWRLEVDKTVCTINAPYIVTDGVKQFLGYDIPLDMPVGEVPELVEAERLCLPGRFGWRCNHVPCFPPLMYFKTGRKWPPCSNWGAGDPINLGPFMIWEGYGVGNTTVPPTEDNSYHNLLLVCYRSGKSVVRKCVNKWTYVKSVVATKRDPLTNLPLNTEQRQSLIDVLNPPPDEAFEAIRIEHFGFLRGVVPSSPIPEFVIDKPPPPPSDT
jgi:hypothetical protein